VGVRRWRAVRHPIAAVYNYVRDMDERSARAWGWILVGLGAVGVVLLMLFMAGTGQDEGCDPNDRLPVDCERGDGGGAFSQPEEGSPEPEGPKDGTLAVFGLLLLAVGGGGALVAFRRSRRLRQNSAVPHPFVVPPPPDAMAQPASAASPMGGSSPLAGVIALGRLASLGVASIAGMPTGVMLGQTGLVASASDGTFQPAFWCVRQGHVQVAVGANGELTPLALSVPVDEAHALLRQWARTQELPINHPGQNRPHANSREPWTRCPPA
jgi:hypothetical protein